MVLSVMVLGLLLVFIVWLSFLVFVVVVGVMGFFYGYVYGIELLLGLSVVEFFVGFIFSMVGFYVVGYGLGWLGVWGVWICCLVGGGVVLVGIGLLFG